MTRDEMFDAITAQRLRLADTLDTLTNDEWNVDSLCAGWRVREVVGHLLSILEIPLPRFLLGTVLARDFNRYADRMAREFAQAHPDDLVRRYRAAATKRFAPPVVGPIAPLTDAFVHTRDIERPLGKPAQFPETPVRTILDYVYGGRAHGFVPPKRSAGLRFVATDLDWATGVGPTVRGTADALMLAVAMRPGVAGELDGDGAEDFRARLG